ncbi:PREDICTED: starch synthase 3, chloroplastic/amyloplastic isoform X2 [Ipomoea nil]|uniref:starch synthase 3, chloroplastic/amyloplastic isoform X2 n=1 Tax=Ipomoea nil TaxID=35883 RepID=UPI000901D147|nr:PREDICTED: starch synthase 3, chloroplastic/amyloplastic isoform X2 [Ipomoea nil]
MEIPLPFHKPLSSRTTLSITATQFKIKPFFGFFPHGTTSLSAHSSSQNKVQVVGGFLHHISASADFPRRKRKVSTPKSEGSSPRGFSSRTATGTSSQRRDQKNIKEKEDEQTSPSKESEVPSQKKIEVKIDDIEDEIQGVEEVEESEGQSKDDSDSGRIPQSVPDISQFASNGVGSKVVNNDIKSSEVKRVTGDDALDVLDRVELGEMPLSDDKAGYLKENESLEFNNFQETAIAETVLETDVLNEIDSEEAQVDIIRSDKVQDEDNEENLSQKALSTVSDARDAAVGTVEGDRQLETTETIVVGEIENSDIDEDNEENPSQKALSTVSDARDAAVGTVEGDRQLETTETIDVGEIENSDIDDGKEEEDYSLKLKLEMEENLRRRAIERLAEENFLQRNKLFYYPEEVKPDEDVEIFLNRSLSTLLNEPDVLIMGGFNDWRWRSFTMNLSKTNLNGDWWSCRLHVPKEAYNIDFVFFNGKDVYDNNNMKDFSITVKDGMDALDFENFLLEEKQRELERIAKEQAQREREAEEKRRIEAEKAASEVDRAQAREEVAKTRKILQAAIDKASKSVSDNWYIEPKEFKSEDKIRLYYNNSSGPLSRANEIWIHGGHNNWMHGLSIIAKLSKSKNKDGDWWYADVVVPDRALILDWVFADGPPGKAIVYDNNNRQDFHAVGSEKIPEDLFWAEKEDQIYKRLQQERRLREEAIRAKAERTARIKAETKERTMKSFFLSQKHVVYTEPLDVRAGSTVTVYYNPANTVLNGKPEIWFRCSFNRWTHRLGPLPPQKMLPAENSSHVKATVKVPLDAYVMDFVFSGNENGGIFDNKNNMDYHIPVSGAIAKEPPMHIVHIAVEMAPIAKVGGLGDVVTSLSRAIQDLNHIVDIILPKYDCVNFNHVKDLEFHKSYSWGGTEVKVWFGKVEGLSVYFLEPQNGFFWKGCIYGSNNDTERFGFFCHAALEFLQQGGFHPDIIHCHDWSSAPVAWLFKEQYMHYGLSKARVVFTIHNLEFGAQFIAKAMQYSDKATTVSPNYSKEVSGNPAIAPHLYKFHGIVNGIDPDIWDPYNDKFIPISYTSENVVEGKRAAKEALQQRLGLKTDDRPLVGIITRLTHQKGIHLIKHALSRTLERGGQVVLLGSAPDPRIQNEFVDLANHMHSAFHGRARLCLTYDEPLSHLIYAGADFILVPSIFEPCGLTQLVAMRYGSIPVVRKTGGLYDTVFDVDHDKERARASGIEPNGFSFDGADAAGVDYALNRAITAWYDTRDWFNSLCKKVMEQDWSWNRPALDYLELYHAARK